MSESIIIHGRGGHGHIVTSAAKLLGYSVSSTDDSDGSRPTVGQKCIIAIGNNEVRREFENFMLTTIIHPEAFVDETATIGFGTFVGPHAAVNANACIGIGVIINTGAIVEHDSKVGNWAHISPGAVVCGNVTIGEGCWIGANAVIREGLVIAPWTIVGCGSAVIHDIIQSGRYGGVPAHSIG